jgi:hypothetical protein
MKAGAMADDENNTSRDEHAVSLQGVSGSLVPPPGGLHDVSATVGYPPDHPLALIAAGEDDEDDDDPFPPFTEPPPTPPVPQRVEQNDPPNWVPRPPPAAPIWVPDSKTWDVAAQIAASRQISPALLATLGTTEPLRANASARVSGAAKLTLTPAPDSSGPGELPSVDSIPQQMATATRFVLDAEGRIDLVPDPAHPDGLQREMYQEVRLKAGALSALGHNQLADLSEPIGRFLATAPERIEDVSITRLWSRGNTLRLRLKAHATAAASTDPTDPALLPTLVAEMLRDVVESYNVFIAGDPRGRELDHVRLGPQEQDAARAIVDAALPIVEAVQASDGLASPAAVEALAEQVEAARDAPAGINGDQAIDLSSKTNSNLVLEILRSAWARVRAEPGFAWKEYRAGIYRGLGTMTVAGLAGWQIITFVVNNAEALKTFVQQAFHNPVLVRIIDLISQAGGP